MKPYYYVYRNEGLAPKYKHKTLKSAQAEAERLALKHAGESFEILKCVGISSAPVPKASTFFVDGEHSIKELPDGEKEYQFPEDFPELPPLPEGKTRWVYCGVFDSDDPPVEPWREHRQIMYWCRDKWESTFSFFPNCHQIEAL